MGKPPVSDLGLGIEEYFFYCVNCSKKKKHKDNKRKRDDDANRMDIVGKKTLKYCEVLSNPD